MTHTNNDAVQLGPESNRVADLLLTASRWWYVLRYYPTSQLLSRAATIVRRRLARLDSSGGCGRAAVLVQLRDNDGFGALVEHYVHARDPEGTAAAVTIATAKLIAGGIAAINAETNTVPITNATTPTAI